MYHEIKSYMSFTDYFPIQRPIKYRGVQHGIRVTRSDLARNRLPYQQISQSKLKPKHFVRQSIVYFFNMEDLG